MHACIHTYIHTTHTYIHTIHTYNTYNTYIHYIHYTTYITIHTLHYIHTYLCMQTKSGLTFHAHERGIGWPQQERVPLLFFDDCIRSVESGTWHKVSSTFTHIYRVEPNMHACSCIAFRRMILSRITSPICGPSFMRTMPQCGLPQSWIVSNPTPPKNMLVE